MKKIAVIGAGPAGMCAAIAASAFHHVDLYDHNEKIGKKLYITGKGRCNLTNKTDIENFFDFIPRNKSFLYSSFYTFTNENLIELMESAGLKLKVERGNRVFPASDKASDVIKTFKKLLDKNKVKIILNAHVSELLIEDNTCLGIKVDGKTKKYDSVILCSGGYTYKQTGSDGSGYEIAKKAGHHITPLQPSLVALKTKESYPGEIAGLTLKNIRINLYKDQKKVYTEIGECLFTHEGLSGPLILTISSLIEKPFSQYLLEIDLKPGLTEEKLDKRILRDFQNNNQKNLDNALKELLPQNLIPIILKEASLETTRKPFSLTRVERQKLVETIKHLKLHITDTERFNTAVVTRGGIDLTEVDPSTMQSKLIKNLFFAGEILDVDAQTGGFNIQIACSTGYLAGLSV